MHKFEYTSPTAKEQVATLAGASWNDAELLAGGTDLVPLMQDGIAQPRRVVNIKGLADLRGITFSQSAGLRIGALTPLADVAENAHVVAKYPALASAIADAASPQIRNMATMGGNLCQRPRCWYFRNGFGLLPTKDGKSLVELGDNRYHAILGNEGPAKFVSPSTIAPMLIALNARIRILGAKGSREIALEKFFITPLDANQREHALQPGEIVTDIFVPTPAAGLKAAHYEVRQKHAFDWPLATAAVALTMNGNTVTSARIVLGHVAPVPWMSDAAARALVGKSLSADVADQAGAAAVQGARPLSQNAYKVQLARVAVKRGLLAINMEGRHR